MSPLVRTRWGGGKERWQVLCPVCRNECVEQQGPTGEASAVTVHEDRDEYDSPIATRGGYTQIKLHCPDGHGFDLIVANHKGCQFIGLVPIGPRDYGWWSEDGAPDAA
jgi:hypothetical protein